MNLLTELEALAKEWDFDVQINSGTGAVSQHAEAIRSLIAAEKARAWQETQDAMTDARDSVNLTEFKTVDDALATGPDPLLVQAREALRRIIGWSEQMKALRELCAKPDAWLDAFVRDVSMAETVIAALDARLGGKA